MDPYQTHPFDGREKHGGCQIESSGKAVSTTILLVMDLIRLEGSVPASTTPFSRQNVIAEAFFRCDLSGWLFGDRKSSSKRRNHVFFCVPRCQKEDSVDLERLARLSIELNLTILEGCSRRARLAICFRDSDSDAKIFCLTMGYLHKIWRV